MRNRGLIERLLDVLSNKKLSSVGASGSGLPPTPIEQPLLPLLPTAYNYTRTYPDLDAVPLCANVPASEAFTADYNALVLRSSVEIASNFLKAAATFLEKELQEDSSLGRIFNYLLADIVTAIEGLKEVSSDALAYGPTAFLRDTLFDVLRVPGKGDTDYLQAKSEDCYKKLIVSLPQPVTLTIQDADWMPKRQPDPAGPINLPCEQDWFFGYLQVAGYNTTNLRGVVLQKDAASKAILLADLQQKMGITDAIFQSVTGEAKLSDAAQKGNLYACDYTGLLGGPGGVAGRESAVHGKLRYLPGPIALFYWNQKLPLDGYPPGYRGDKSATDGVLQPVAIQLSPEPGSAIFTPNIPDAGAGDPHGWKWKIAKYFVNVACAIQHESVAHLADCHFIMEAITVATRRRLVPWHPVHVLLAPHLRFTLPINAGALSNLLVPGGVVASNVGADIHWTLTMANEARKAWRWNENNPDAIFALRGVDVDRSLVFPFRDDTILLWEAIKRFVGRYVDHHFTTDAAMLADPQLAAWFDELLSPQHADFQGLERPKTRADLAMMLAQIIHTAGPLHASVNFAQYPLGAFVPAVAASIYQPAPTRDTVVDESNYLKWFPPLDIALYSLSFEYLLSSIQYDVFGQYADNPQFPYFDAPELQQALEDFQSDLMSAEIQIRARNRNRPMPYPYQLPSRIPNSVSI